MENSLHWKYVLTLDKWVYCQGNKQLLSQAEKQKQNWQIGTKKPPKLASNHWLPFVFLKRRSHLWGQGWQYDDTLWYLYCFYSKSIYADGWSHMHRRLKLTLLLVHAELWGRLQFYDRLRGGEEAAEYPSFSLAGPSNPEGRFSDCPMLCCHAARYILCQPE